MPAAYGWAGHGACVPCGRVHPSMLFIVCMQGMQLMKDMPWPYVNLTFEAIKRPTYSGVLVKMVNGWPNMTTVTRPDLDWLARDAPVPPPYPQPPPTPPPPPRRVTKLAAGAYHTCAALEGGYLRCWGYNDYGQLGLGVSSVSSLSISGDADAGILPYIDVDGSVADLACGYKHTCAVLGGGIVKCWGANQQGQIGIGSLKDRIGTRITEMGDALPPVRLGSSFDQEGVKAIIAGSQHSCALLASGVQIKCWGGNAVGQLGVGDTRTRGRSQSDMGDKLPPVGVILATPTASSGAVNMTTAGIFSGPLASATGAYFTLNTSGAFPYKHSIWGTFNVSGTGWSYVSLGPQHYCGVSASNGKLRCAGAYLAPNSDTPYPNEDDTPMPPKYTSTSRVLAFSSKVAAVACGLGHTCVLLESGSVKCWGSNLYGQLGVPADRYNFSAFKYRVVSPVDVPDVYLGEGRTATQVTVGDVHTCALLDDGTVKCWGRNNWGQLGLGSSVTSLGHDMTIVPIVPLQ